MPAIIKGIPEQIANNPEFKKLAACVGADYTAIGEAIFEEFIVRQTLLIFDSLDEMTKNDEGLIAFYRNAEANGDGVAVESGRRMALIACVLGFAYAMLRGAEGLPENLVKESEQSNRALMAFVLRYNPNAN